MAELGDFLGGTPTNSIQTPGAQDPGFQERKAGWLNAFKQMAADPKNAGMLAQIGMSLANRPAPGVDLGAHAVNALGAGLNYRGRIQAAEDERIKQEMEQARQQQRVDLEARRAGLDEKRLGLDERRLESDSEYQRGQLESAKEDRRSREKIAAMNRDSQNQSTSDLRTIIARLEQQYPQMPFDEIVKRAKELTTVDDSDLQLLRIAADRATESTYTNSPLSLSEAYVEMKEVYQSGKGGSEPKGPVKVQSEEEALRLAPGTRFVLPDGRSGTVQ